MTDYTPDMVSVKTNWMRYRSMHERIESSESAKEINRFFEAHDQGIRDACRPSTPAELIEAAWDAAYPLPEGRRLPADTPYLWKDVSVEGHTRIVFWPNGEPIDTAYGARVRTLTPLPPVIPDDCMAVWASCDHTPGLGRTIWQRSDDATTWFALDPAYGGWFQRPLSELIDPKPVPEEER